MKGNIIRFRKAVEGDVEFLKKIYGDAKTFMRASGNQSQWSGNYPGEKEILYDISKGNLWVGVDGDKEIAVVFAFIIGEDPTYSVIDGQWLSDDPYGTIHRIASSGKHGRMLDACIDFALGLIPNLRIDTHKDNGPMLNALQRTGFHRCGVIICSDGTPREAFQLYNNVKDKG